MKRLGMHRVDGRSYWFAAYFNAFDRARMIEYAGAARAERFAETFGGRLPFAEARIVSVFDTDATAAAQFAATFDVAVAQTLEEFAIGLDGVIVPFPAGGPARDYEAVAPLARGGLPLFLDRIILEQSPALGRLLQETSTSNVPLHVSSFTRYLAAELLPSGVVAADCVLASTAGDASGYGADLLDLVDELMPGCAVSVVNVGDVAADVLRIAYDDGRHAILQLCHDLKAPMTVTALGSGWSRSLTLDGSLNHVGAMRQFEAFLGSLESRQPPVPYSRVLTNAAILHVAQRREFGREVILASGR